MMHSDKMTRRARLERADIPLYRVAAPAISDIWLQGLAADWASLAFRCATATATIVVSVVTDATGEGPRVGYERGHGALAKYLLEEEYPADPSTLSSVDWRRWTQTVMSSASAWAHDDDRWRRDELSIDGMNVHVALTSAPRFWAASVRHADCYIDVSITHDPGTSAPVRPIDVALVPMSRSQLDDINWEMSDFKFG